MPHGDWSNMQYLHLVLHTASSTNTHTHARACPRVAKHGRPQIPKVDPEPSDDIDFDIIQPVLQYPGTSLSGGWELKSWCVRALLCRSLYSRT